MLEINTDVIYIRGAVKGAIYDFNTENLYWISADACDLIERIASDPDFCLKEDEKAYINSLVTKQLLSEKYFVKEYSPIINSEQALELAWLEITQSCNCKCLHCYQGETHTSSSLCLKLEDWERVIDELASNHVSRVVVIGGEPCINKDIIPILQRLCKHKIKSTIFTNATCISADLFDFIVDNKDILSVKVSLYGKTSEIHDNITQNKGSFDKLVSTITKLTASGVRVDIAVVAMKENQSELKNIDLFIKDLGANYSKFDVIRNVFGGCQDQHTPTDTVIINSAKHLSPNFCASKTRFLKNINTNSCWYGKIAITETGDVLPCVFERNKILGNVLTSSIKDILNSRHLSEAWYMDYSQIEQCKDCEFRYACKDCRPLGTAVNGNPYHKNPRCCYDPYLGEWKNNG